MKIRFRKIVVFAILGVSVLTASGGLSVMNPLTVQAAVSKPKINLTKKRTITVGRGSQLELYKNVIKSVKRGSYSVKSVKVKAVKAANGKKISIKNSPIATSGKIPAKTLKFPATAGTYKLKVTAKDTKGNASNSTVSFKVGKKLSSYVTGLKTYKVKKGSKVNFMNGVAFNNTYVKSIKVDSSRVDLSSVGTYKVYYTIVGKAGDKLKVSKNVTVYEEKKPASSDTTTPSNPTKPSNPTEAPSSNPAAHVKGIADRVVVARSRNLNLLDGVTWDETIKSVKVTNFNDIYDPTNFDLPWFGNNELGVANWIGYFYDHTELTYTITPKVGSPVNVYKMLYIVDLPTAKDLAQYVPVYTSSNELVVANPNSYHTCDIKVSGTKIIVPAHKLEVCFNCNEEIKANDFDKLDEHEMNSYLASKGEGPEGAIPGCYNTWYTTVEGFTINR